MPEYRKKRSARIDFLETDKGFGSFGLKDAPAGRRQFVERLPRRAQREKRKEYGLAEIEGQGLQSTLRRGWRYGSTTFKDRLLGLAEELLALRSKRRNVSQNYRGAEACDHGIRQAEAIVKAGLGAFGISEDDLPGPRNSAVEKALIASIIRTETAVPVAWITEKLNMGTTANVTRASKIIVERLPGDRRLKHVRKQIYATIPS